MVLPLTLTTSVSLTPLLTAPSAPSCGMWTTQKSPTSNHASSPTSSVCSKATSEKCRSPAAPNTNSLACTSIFSVTARPQSTCRPTSKALSTRATFQLPRQPLPPPPHPFYTSKLHRHSYHSLALAFSTVLLPNSSTLAHVLALIYSLPSVSYVAV
jgi:hypothetical protein